MKTFFLSIFLILVGLMQKPAEAMSDEEYEDQLYGIYRNHYSRPVSHSDWMARVQSLPADYKLKFKDNFWDLSGSFFNNSLYWSKLWTANPRVENPHLIYQGDSIKFDVQTLSSLARSPYVDLNAMFPGLEIPEDRFARKSLSEEELPSSLPKLRELYQIPIYEMDLSRLSWASIEKHVSAPYYLIDEDPPISGEIISKDGHGFSASLEGEQLVAKINGTVSIGGVFTVFENRGSIGGLFQFLKGWDEKEIMIKGTIKVLSYLKGTNSLYLVSIQEPMNRMLPGDLFFRGEPVKYEFSQKGPIGSGSGRIMGTPHRDRMWFSLNSVVYLDKGGADGVRKGDMFYIQSGGKGQLPIPRPYKYDQAYLGKLKIIHVSGNASTGIIVSARGPVHIGDIWTGAPSRIEDLSASSMHESEEYMQESDLLMDFEETEDDEGAEVGGGTAFPEGPYEEEEALSEMESGEVDEMDLEEMEAVDDPEWGDEEDMKMETEMEAGSEGEGDGLPAPDPGDLLDDEEEGLEEMEEEDMEEMEEDDMEESEEEEAAEMETDEEEELEEDL